MTVGPRHPTEAGRLAVGDILGRIVGSLGQGVDNAGGATYTNKIASRFAEIHWKLQKKFSLPLLGCPQHILCVQLVVPVIWIGFVLKRIEFGSLVDLKFAVCS